MNLRQVRKKIKSISNVKKITKAMQMVSSIKMRKAQAAEMEGRPYRNGLQEIMEKISPGADPSFSKLMSVKNANEKAKTLCIFVTSNKGLCGGFHVNLSRHIIRNYDYKTADFISVGKKGSVFLGKLGRAVIADFSSHMFVTEVSAIFELALNKFLSGEYKKVDVIYSQFLSTLKNEIITQQLLPVSLDFAKPKEKKDLTGEYLIEPSPNEILDFVLRSYVEDKIRGAIVSSEAVEHSSRMIAMKNATDNANDVIYNFTLLSNKLRQEKITGELLDMVTAKESVESN